MLALSFAVTGSWDVENTSPVAVTVCAAVETSRRSVSTVADDKFSKVHRYIFSDNSQFPLEFCLSSSSESDGVEISSTVFSEEFGPLFVNVT